MKRYSRGLAPNHENGVVFTDEMMTSEDLNRTFTQEEVDLLFNDGEGIEFDMEEVLEAEP